MRLLHVSGHAFMVAVRMPPLIRSNRNQKGRGPMGDTAAALRMLDTFARCGAQSFVVTKTELEYPGHKKVKWGKTYSTDELRQKLPSMVRTAAIRRPVTLSDGGTMMAGENLIMRPIGANTAFVQLDDLSQDQLDRLHDAACIIHATSPGNFQ